MSCFATRTVQCRCGSSKAIFAGLPVVPADAAAAVRDSDRRVFAPVASVAGEGDVAADAAAASANDVH